VRVSTLPAPACAGQFVAPDPEVMLSGGSVAP